jgi:hypothetical protein
MRKRTNFVMLPPVFALGLLLGAAGAIMAVEELDFASHSGPCDVPLDALQVRQHCSPFRPFQVSLLHSGMLQVLIRRAFLTAIPIL